MKVARSWAIWYMSAWTVFCSKATCRGVGNVLNRHPLQNAFQVCKKAVKPLALTCEHMLKKILKNWGPDQEEFMGLVLHHADRS